MNNSFSRDYGKTTAIFNENDKIQIDERYDEKVADY